MDFLGFDYVKGDLKSLKKYKGIKDDIKENARVFGERIQDNWSTYSDLYNLPCCHFICSMSIKGIDFFVYKHRCGIRSYKIGPSDGLRILFGTTKKLNVYLPILVFKSDLEKTMYRTPDGKQHPLSRDGFKKIVAAKLHHF